MKTNYEHYREEIKNTNLSIRCFLNKLRTSSYDCHRDGEIGCNECLEESLEWLFSEYKEPIQMTLFEKSILECAVNHGYEWIARDSIDNLLSVHKEEPEKSNKTWISFEVENPLDLFNDKFQFIQWTDEEPYHIPTLLEECEVVE